MDGDLVQSVLWYAIAAIWALIAIARWLSDGPDGSDAMTHFGIAFILANIFVLRSEMGVTGEKIASVYAEEATTTVTSNGGDHVIVDINLNDNAESFDSGSKENSRQG